MKTIWLLCLLFARVIAFAQTDADAYYNALLQAVQQDYSKCLGQLNLRTPTMPAKQESAGAKHAGKLLIAIDSSGSMAAKRGGESRMDAAKNAVQKFMAGLPADVKAGLLAYGHKGNNKPDGKSESCAGIELITPVGEADARSISEAASRFQPTGWTPLAAAIRKSGEVFGGDESAKVLYVVSDGIETCGGNPVEAARGLQSAQVKVMVNLIGFGVPAAERRQLQAVAAAGGGRYLSAETGADLLRVLQEDTKRSLEEFQFAVKTAVAGANNAVQTSTTTSRVMVCFNNRLNNEQTRANLKMAADMRGSKPKLDQKLQPQVQAKLKARHDRIRQWANEHIAGLRTESQANHEALQRGLDEVTR